MSTGRRRPSPDFASANHGAVIRRRRGAIGPTADDASSESGTASADIKGNNGASQATPVDEKTE